MKHWWKHTTIYQIYPRSFQDTNGDGIGDIQGLLSRLDYLKDLGIETIWISPMYKSPGKDFGYDISDYCAIDPLFGTLDEAIELIRAVHERKMKIVFDMVLNHTSNEHVWFQESSSSISNAKRDYYIWKKGKNNQPPNNWISMVGKSGWNFDPKTNEYYYSNFLSFQPDLNYRNPKVKEEMFQVMRFWLDKGVDGFRLDIFNSIYKDEGFLDNPFSFRYLPTPDNNDEAYFQEKKYTLNLPENFELAKEVRSLTESYPHEPFLIGEVSGNDKVLKGFLGEKEDGLNLVFQFELIDFQFRADFFRKIIAKNELEFPAPFQPTYVFGNHDQKRSISKVGGDVQKAKLLAFFQLTARGIPVIYYGEEIGMLEGTVPNHKGLDPIAQQNRWVPDWLSNLLGIYLNRDNCRTPMTWDDSPNAGFTSANPWNSYSPETKLRNVKKETVDPSSLLNLYQKLLHLRKSEASLHGGSISLLEGWRDDKDILAYERIAMGSQIQVYLNFGNVGREIRFDSSQYDPLYKSNASELFLLEPYEGMLLRKK
jgi:alpha-glucosidase